VPLAWWMADWEEEREALGPDPWEYGLSERNQKNYGTLMNYVCRQVLGGKKMKLKDLFPKEAFALKAPFKRKYKVKPGF
jgi:4,5-dihydroxyphthalate decarboxylase